MCVCACVCECVCVIYIYICVCVCVCVYVCVCVCVCVVLFSLQQPLQYLSKQGPSQPYLCKVRFPNGNEIIFLHKFINNLV